MIMYIYVYIHIYIYVQNESIKEEEINLCLKDIENFDFNALPSLNMVSNSFYSEWIKEDVNASIIVEEET